MFLDEQTAKDIFALRPETLLGAAQPIAVGKRFGVSEKTVRDIWVGRTWRRVTRTLAKAPYCRRAPGRPRRVRRESELHEWAQGFFVDGEGW